MKTKVGQRFREVEEFEVGDGTGEDEQLTAQELEEVLFEPVQEEVPDALNLPVVSGLALFAICLLYLLQLVRLLPSGVDLTDLVTALILIAGGLVVGMGTGVLGRGASSRRSSRKTTRKKRKKRAAAAKAMKQPRRLRKASGKNRKILGVCGGLADYFGISATALRIVLLISVIPTSGASILGYLGFAMVMLGPENPDTESS